jgi:hypothetical protein
MYNHQFTHIYYYNPSIYTEDLRELYRLKMQLNQQQYINYNEFMKGSIQWSDRKYLIKVDQVDGLNYSIYYQFKSTRVCSATEM